MYPALATSLIRGTVDLLVPQHVAQAFPTPIWCVIRLLNVRKVLGDQGLPKHFKSLEDAFIGEVEATVAMATVLLDGFLEGTLLGDVSLFVAVVAKAIAASTSKEGTLYRTSMTWGQGHPILDRRAYWGVGDMCVSNLF